MDATTGVLSIRLLGRFEVFVDGEVIPEERWTRRKAKAIVKILALAPNLTLHRDEIVEALWPETNPDSSLNNFHKALHAARRALEPSLRTGGLSRFLALQDQRVELRAAELWIDVREFAAAAAAGDPAALDRALALYTGPLLEEDRYEDWTSSARERLDRLHENLLLRAGARAEREEDWTSAADRWSQCLSRNACNEDAHRGLMRVYTRQGRRHLAIEQYRQCVTALDRELSIAPEPATDELYRRIADGSEPHQWKASVPDPLPEAPPRKATSRRGWIAAALTVAGGAAAAAWWKFVSTAPMVRTLAVLPFESPPELEYIADGATEGLINRLSRFANLRVMARSTVFTLKGRAAEPRQSGRQLGVDAVLVGRVRQLTGPLLVSVELVDTKDGAQIWGHQFEFEAREITQLQARLASEIAAALAIRLEPDQRQRLARAETRDAEAHRNYLLGRYHANQRTVSALRQAIALFEKAVAQDANYALAHAGLADALGLLAFQYVPPSSVLPRVRESVSRALTLDPGLAEAHTSLGMIHALYDWDAQGARAAFQRAIELNPGYVTAHHWLGVHLNGSGQHEEGRRELEIARQLDPLSRIVATNLAYPDLFQRRFGPAIAQLEKVLEIDPKFSPAHEDLMICAEAIQDYARARRHALLLGDRDLEQAALALEPTPPAGQYRRMLGRWRDRLLGRQRGEYVSPILLAQISARAKETDTAFHWLDRAVEERSAPLVYLRFDPQYDSIRTDPRFTGLVRRIWP